MSIPTDISGDVLAKKLTRYGYRITRQKGSHIRLTTKKGGTHHITIPKHNPLKAGTLNGIINDIAGHQKISKKQVMEELFHK